MKTAVLTNIQRGSLHDGPGVRITFFFQGCNLGCRWCHNPETRPKKPQLMYYNEKCIGCGLCKEVCKNQECISCFECVRVCPTGAKATTGKEFSTEEMLALTLREAAFFGERGGVTCSGGEPMLQIDALTEFLSLCKKNNIHTAVDTALNIPWCDFEKIIPFTDLILADYKHFDENEHIKYTGASRKLIIENLEKLCKSDLKIILRMPIITGVHDNEEYITAAGNELLKIGFKGEIELLPFHRLGCNKYLALNQNYDFAKTLPPNEAKMKLLSQKLRQFGFKVMEGV